MNWVVDASALLVTGAADGLEAALTMQRAQQTRRILAPALLACECGNVIHRKHPEAFGRDAPSRSAALELILEQTHLVPPRDMLRRLAGALAEDHRLSFYDAEYLALAVAEDAALITEDHGLRAAAIRVLGASRALDWNAARRSLAATAA